MLWKSKCKKYFKVLSKKIKEINPIKKGQTGGISRRDNMKIIGASNSGKGIHGETAIIQ